MPQPLRKASPYPPGYSPISGNVAIPNPDDPVGMQQLGNTTYFDFGAQQAFGQLPAPVTQSETGAEAYLKALGKIPDMPRDLMRMNKQQRQQIGYEPSIGDLRFADEQAMKSKPAQSNVINRGGMGKAGRGNKSQFDLGPQFLTDQPGLEPLEMPYSDVSDKPWDLDDNTNADVAPGTKLDPQPDKPVAPDLNTPRGMFEALSKKYPDILTRNLEEMEQARVTPQDVEDVSDRAGLGSLFIAASKAASSAGAVGGKQAESIAPQIVQREDTLARQRLKDRLDVADSNMSLSAKAVDLAMKQINFADEREQYDPNSEVSRFARDFMRQEFEVNVPDNVPAYQLKQFLPAVVQKYQATERAKYQSALLGQKTEENLLNDAYKRYEAALKSGDRQAQIKTQKEIATLKAMAKPLATAKTPKPEKMLGGVEKSVADAEFKIADKFNGEPAVKKYKTGAIALQEMESLAKEETAESDQGLINGYAKILDPESVVREGEYATVAKGGGILNQIKNAADVSLGEARLQPAQRQKLLEAARALQRGRQSEYSRIRSQYEERARQYGLDPQRSLGIDDVVQPSAGVKAGGRSIEEIDAEIAATKAKKAKRDAEKARQKGGQ